MRLASRRNPSAEEDQLPHCPSASTHASQAHRKMSGLPQHPNMEVRLYKYKHFVQKNKIIGKQRGKEKVVEERVAFFKTMQRVLPVRMQPQQEYVQQIYDWIMEASALLKLTKNTYYRALLIVQRLTDHDPSLLLANSKPLPALICAAISLVAKYQNSRINFLDAIFIMNRQRVPKHEIITAENEVLKIIKWKMPIVLIEEEISQLIDSWQDFVSGEYPRREKLMLGRDSAHSANCYIEIVYLMDHIVIRRHQVLLKEGNMRLPLLYALYIQLSLCLGDFSLTQNYLWPIFQKFVLQSLLLNEMELSTFRGEVIGLFNELNLRQVLGSIPLNQRLKHERAIQRHEQIYIPKSHL